MKPTRASYLPEESLLVGVRKRRGWGLGRTIRTDSQSNSRAELKFETLERRIVLSDGLGGIVFPLDLLETEPLAAQVSYADADGQTFSFVNITNNDSDDADIGESQLFVHVSQVDDDVLFTFENIGPEASSITDVYFDDNAGVLTSTFTIHDDLPGVSFSVDASPSNLPGGNEVGFYADYPADSDSPAQPNGVNPGEWVGFQFQLDAGMTYDDVINALTGGTLVVGIHVQGYASGGSESFITKPEPGDPSIEKSVVDTSLDETGTEQHNSGLHDLAIGETVTYEILLTIPEGWEGSGVFTDQLELTTGVLSTQQWDVNVEWDAAELVVSDPVVDLVDSNGDGFFDRYIVSFDSIRNELDGSGIDASDQIVFTITARAEDVGANQDGDLLTNLATFAYVTQTTEGEISDSADVDVVEPDLNIIKTVDDATVYPGQTVTYTLTIEHTTDSTAPAFQLTLSDVFPDDVTYVPGTTVFSTAPDSWDEGSFEAVWGAFLLGETLTVSFQATVDAGAPVSEELVNTAEIGWQSLPADDEYDGRSYTDEDDVPIIVVSSEFGFDKSIFTTSRTDTGSSQYDPTVNDVAIGEVVTYHILVTVPEGFTGDANLTDFVEIDEGVLKMLDASILLVGANVSFEDSDRIYVDRNTDAILDGVVFTITGLSNHADGVRDQNDTIMFEVRARVLDVEANVNGDELLNTATLTTDLGKWSDTALVEVVEPELNIVKSTDFVAGDAGDVATYTLVVDHTSNATLTAYDLNITDLLEDPDLLLVSGTVTTTAGVVVSGNTAGDQTVSVFVSEFALDDEPIVITFDARLGPQVRVADEVPNTGRVRWDDDPEEGGRVGEDEDQAVVTTITPEFDKQVFTTSLFETGTDQHDPDLEDLAIGETATFELTVRVPEGTMTAQIVDQLPLTPGVLSLVSSEIVWVGGNISGAWAVGTIGNHVDTDGDGHFDRIVFPSRTIFNQFDNVETADDLIVVRVTARVEDVAGTPVDGDVLTNHATLDYSVGTLSDTADVEVVEPILSIDKSVDVARAEPGDVVTYTITIGHTATSTSAAFDLVLSDFLPADVTYVPGSLVHVDGVTPSATDDANGRLDLRWNRLLLEETSTFSFAAVVNEEVAHRTVIVNTGDVTWDSYPDEFGRPGQDEDGVQTLVLLTPPPVPPRPPVTPPIVGPFPDSEPILVFTPPQAFGGSPPPPLGFTPVTIAQTPAVDRRNLTGNFVPAFLSGFVFQDLNNNGIKDEGEPGVGGVTVKLFGPTNRIVETDPNGLYLFEDLRPGVYTVFETQPGRFLDGSEQSGSLGGVFGSNDTMSEILLRPAQKGIFYNFGELPPASLEGFVYEDVDGNGERDLGEPGIFGVNVTLSGSNDRGESVDRALATDGDGAYLFEDLRPGSYAIAKLTRQPFHDGPDRVGTLGGTLTDDGRFVDITLSPGQHGRDYAFGEWSESTYQQMTQPEPTDALPEPTPARSAEPLNRQPSSPAIAARDEVFTDGPGAASVGAHLGEIAWWLLPATLAGTAVAMTAAVQRARHVRDARKLAFAKGADPFGARRRLEPRHKVEGDVELLLSTRGSKLVCREIDESQRGIGLTAPGFGTNSVRVGDSIFVEGFHGASEPLPGIVRHVSTDKSGVARIGLELARRQTAAQLAS